MTTYSNDAILVILALILCLSLALLAFLRPLRRQIRQLHIRFPAGFVKLHVDPPSQTAAGQNVRPPHDKAAYQNVRIPAARPQPPSSDCVFMSDEHAVEIARRLTWESKPDDDVYFEQPDQ